MRPLRPLLPAATRPRPPSPVQRRERIASACEACRTRKTKCNGERPKCLECAKRDTKCFYAARSAETQSQAIKRKYDELQSENEAYVELFKLIQNRPESESLEILRRIKMGAGVESVVRHVREGDLLIQLTLIPESRLRYTLPYITTMPEFLLVPDNPYLTSPLYEATFNQSSPASPVHDQGSISGPLDRYMKPRRAAEVVEPLLDRVCVRDWTTIITDDGLFRRLLALYLAQQHASFYWFNKDLFLEDMAARRTRFCSSLLVNAVLANACQAYDGIPDLEKTWKPDNLSTKFLSEARRLWDLESGTSRITTIHAGMVMHSTLNCNCMDVVGKEYTIRALSTARDLNLFTQIPAGVDSRTRRGWEYAAWGLWIWQITEAHSFRHVPAIIDPPVFPIPDPDNDPMWFGELYVRYPLSSTLIPILYGHCVKATIELRLIMKDIVLLLYDRIDSVEPSHGQLVALVTRLETWRKNLPRQLDPRKISLPSQFRVLGEYHMVLHSLVQAYAAKEANAIEPLPFLGSSSALEIQRNAHISLETLMRVWFLRHSFNSHDAWVALFLTFLGNLALESLNDQESSTAPPLATREVFRSTIVLCINGLNDQSHHYYLGALLSRSLLQRLTPEDTALVSSHLSSSSTSIEGPFRSLASKYPLPNVKVVDGQGSATLHTLLDEFSEMSLAQQSSTGNNG